MSENNDPSVWEGTDVIGEDVRELPVRLTEDERTTRGRELGLQVKAVLDLEDEQRQAMRDFRARQKAEMATALAERQRLADAVNTGEEPRPVKCMHLADYPKGVAYIVRADTSQTVVTRRLTKDEVQVQMPVPLRVVPDPTTGKLRRADGGALDTLPLVKPSQCNAMACRLCDMTVGHAHEAGCDLAGMGDAALVARDQCRPLECLECNVPVGSRHADSCKHVED